MTSTERSPTPSMDRAAAPTALITAGDLRVLLSYDREAGWRQFDSEFRYRLGRYALTMTASADAAADLAQETLIRWYRAFTERGDQIPDEQPIFAWLATTCRRLHIDRQRRAREVLTEEAHLPGATEGCPYALLFRIDQGECLRLLSASHRVLLDRCAEGWSIRELEVELEQSRGAIGRRLAAVKQAVQECLAGRGWTESDVRQRLSHA